jgi:Raf kinase inhibitor-like YbhB/YbcL family protein
MAALALESSVFEYSHAIPSRYTCDGDDVSPPLRWANVPEEARSLALLVDDPDAPRGVFTHWVARGLDGGTGGLCEGEAAHGAGRNDSERSATEGRAHRGARAAALRLSLYALDRDLQLDPGAGKPELEQAIEGHVLTAAELVGTYER